MLAMDYRGPRRVRLAHQPMPEILHPPDEVEYRLEFARRYAPCEAYNFHSLVGPVLFAKRTTDSLGRMCASTRSARKQPAG